MRRAWPLMGMLVTVPVLAQEAAAPAEQEVPKGAEEPVSQTVVTASRSVERLEDTTVAIEVITRRDLEASGARDVAELLSAHPGLELTPTFAGAALQIQGLNPEYALILVDGERVTGRLGGQLDLARFSTEDIEQIEIVKGPSSVLYGSDAIAGVVNIVTRKARRPLGADAQVSYGGLRQLELDASAEASGEKWGARVSGGYQRRDAFDLDQSGPGTDGSSFDGFQVSGRGEIRPTGWLQLEAAGGASRQVQRGVDASATGAVFDRASQNETVEATVLPSLKLSDTSLLSLTGHYSRFRHRFVYDQRGSTALDQVEEVLEQMARAGAQLNQTFADSHQLLVGAELIGETISSDRLEGGRGSRSRLSFFAQDAWRLPLPVKLVVVPGARLDVDSQFGTEFTPRLATRVDLTGALTLRASYGFAFRAPSFQELLIDFENPSVGYVVAGNTALRPETSRGLNISAEVRPATSTLLWLNVFRHDLTNMIAVVTLEDSPGLRFSYDNIARAYVQGAELGWKQKLPAGLVLDLGYTFTFGRNADSELPLEGQAPHRVTGLLSWRYRPWGLEASVRGSFVGPRPYFTDDDDDGNLETIQASPYSTLDARVAKELFDRIRIFVAGNNLLGVGDSYYLPVPPRTFYAGLMVRL
jgi:outer membrane receptor for ferrienterochelin and colicins